MKDEAEIREIYDTVRQMLDKGLIAEECRHSAMIVRECFGWALGDIADGDFEIRLGQLMK